MEKNKQIEEYIQSHPHQFKDEIDKWLFREFSLLGGACASQLSMQYNTAREVAEKAFEYAKEQMLKWKHDVSFCSYANDSVSIEEYMLLILGYPTITKRMKMTLEETFLQI